MNLIKFICAIGLLIASTCVNAVIIDGKFLGWVGNDYSTEGMWSKDLWQSEVTGEFWYDTELAPAATSNIPTNPANYTAYRSQTNSWVNLTFFIDGKTIDISKADNPSLAKGDEGISVYADGGDVGFSDSFSIHDQVLEGDLLGDYVLKSADIRLNGTTEFIQHNGLEQHFFWGEEMCCSDLFFTIMGSKNGKSFASHMEFAITEISFTPREASVPEPSSFSLIVLGLIALMLRHFALLDQLKVFRPKQK